MGDSLNLFDFQSVLNPAKKALGERVPSVSEGIPTKPTPAIGTYSPPVIRRKNIPTVKPNETKKAAPAIGNLSSEKVQFLIDKGYSNDVIVELAFEEQETPSFGDKVVEASKERFGKALEASEDKDTNKFTKAFAVGGETVALGFDILGEAVSAITPDEVKEAGRKAMGKVWDTIPESVQNTAVSALKEGGEAWSSFSEEYPETARNLTSAFQISGVIPLGKGASLAGEGAISSAKTVGKLPSKILPAVDAVSETAGVGIDKAKASLKDTVGRVIDRKEIAEGKGVFVDGRYVGSESDLDIAARRLSGAEGTEYNAALAQKVAKDITDEEVNAIEKATDKGKVMDDILGKKIDEASSLQKELAKTNTKRFTEEDMTISSKDGLVVENPVRKGLDKIASSKGLSVDEKEAILKWRSKLDNEGALSAEDVSDISIMMGKKQGDFTQLINGVEAKDIEFERLRKEVKDVYRKNSSDVAAKLDEVLHANLDTRHYWKELAEKAKQARAATDASAMAIVGKGLANTPLLGNVALGIARALVRTTSGSGQAREVMLAAQEFVDDVAKNIKKVQKLTKEVGSAKTKEEAKKVIEQGVGEIEENMRKIREDAIRNKLFPKTNPALPAPTSPVKNVDVINVRPIQVPPGGFNKPEITPKSVIRKPSTTPIRKKNIPKPKK